MSWEVLLIALVVIGCTTGLIEDWISRKNSAESIDKESFNHIVQDLKRQQRDMKKRIRQLEAAVSEEDYKEPYPEIDEEDRNVRLTNDLQE
ncbi:hypothetical protein [Halalkalibaculum sp. DA384]|uniref:hypothetical protein n=1 Tax=Halalkalibaculum sp. DA384 TaxID=3373606 RepID=UPI00375412B9